MNFRAKDNTLVSKPTNWLTIGDLRGPILERNLAALANRNPELAKYLSALPDNTDVSARTSGGPLYRCRIRKEDSWLWIHGQQPIGAENRGLVDLAINAYQDAETDLFCLLGFGLGYVTSEIFSWFPEEQNPFEHPRGLLVLERDPYLFLIALSLFDWQNFLGSKHVFIGVGPDLETQWKTLCENEGLASCNKMAFLFGYPVRDGEEKNRYLALAGALKRQWDEARPLPIHYKNALLKRDWDDVRHAPKRVWSWVNPVEKAIPHILGGLFDAIERRGITNRLYQVESNRYYPPWHKFHDWATYNPDLIIQINRPTSPLFPDNWAREIPIPRVVWYVDSPRNFWQDHAEFYLTEYDCVCVWDESYVSFLKERGAKEVHILPYAADRQPPGEFSERFRCPISFVGQVMDQSQTKALLNTEERSYLDGIIEEKLARTHEEFRSIIERCPPPPSVNFDALSKKILVDYYLYVEANAKYRIRVLESLVRFGLKLYGPESWLSVLPEKSV